MKKQHIRQKKIGRSIYEAKTIQLGNEFSIAKMGTRSNWLEMVVLSNSNLWNHIFSIRMLTKFNWHDNATVEIKQ